MKPTRILLLLGTLCFAAEYALNIGPPQTMGGGVVDRWIKSSDNSSEKSANAGHRVPDVTRSTAPKPPSNALNSPGEDFDFSSYVNNGRPSIVYFYADWCPACRELSPVLADINREDPEIQVLFLDIAEWNSPIADRYGVSYVPYLRVYDQQGSLMAEGRDANDWVQVAVMRRQVRQRAFHRLKPPG